MGDKCFLRFGSASVKITPPQGTHMAGYFTQRKSEGVYDDLFANILFLEKGRERILFVSCDLVGAPSGFASPLRKLVSDKTGIPAGSIMVSATHTHTGPVMRGDLADGAYLASIIEKTAEAAEGAVNGAEDGSIGYGSRLFPGYAFNRRFFMKDGSVLTNPGIDNPDVVKPAASVDESLNVMGVSDASGLVRAVLVNTALHPDTVSGSMISADWPGYLSMRVKESFPSADVLFLNGTQGDINHFDVLGKRTEQGIDEAKRIGSAYGSGVVDILGSLEPVGVQKLGSDFRLEPVPRRRIDPKELAESRELVEKFAEEYDLEKSGRILESQDIARGDMTVKVFFAKSMVEFHEKYDGTSINMEISAFRIGDIGLVGLSGEIFTEIGLAIKKQSPFNRTLVASLSNGYNGYVPTARAFREGGYETMPRGTSQFGEEAEAIIIGASLEMLKSLYG